MAHRNAWGVITPNSIATVAPRGEAQARSWAAYTHRGIGGAAEVLARHDGDDWVKAD